MKVRQCQNDIVLILEQYEIRVAFYDFEQPDWQSALILWQTLASHPSVSPSQVDAIRVHQVRCLINLRQLDQARSLAQSIQSAELRNSAFSYF